MQIILLDISWALRVLQTVILTWEGESGGCVLQPAAVMNEFQEPTFYSLK